MSSDDELFAKLDRWLVDQPAAPTIFDVVRSGDVELFAAYVLRHFRAAAKKAVADRLNLEAGKLDGSTSTRTSAIAVLVDWLALTWKLSLAEQLQLLGLTDKSELEAVRSLSALEATHEQLERLALLIDIYQATHALLPEAEAADLWLRQPNGASLFGGETALAMMMQRGRRGIQEVRDYLWAQIC